MIIVKYYYFIISIINTVNFDFMLFQITQLRYPDIANIANIGSVSTMLSHMAFHITNFIEDQATTLKLASVVDVLAICILIIHQKSFKVKIVFVVFYFLSYF